jgi:hypothetical protein
VCKAATTCLVPSKTTRSFFLLQIVADYVAELRRLGKVSPDHRPHRITIAPTCHPAVHMPVLQLALFARVKSPIHAIVKYSSETPCVNVLQGHGTWHFDRLLRDGTIDPANAYTTNLAEASYN